MKFKVTTNDKTIILSESDLFDMLTSKIDTANPKEEFEILNTLIYKSLEQNNVINSLLRQKLVMNIFYIVFCVGYYYRLFLEKNNVEIIKEDHEYIDENNTNATGN
jgi:hypothetical protein